MAEEWWLPEEPTGSKAEDSATPLPSSGTPPIQSNPESLVWDVRKSSEEKILDIHYTRIKKIVLALFAMVFLTAIFPPAIVLVLPYGMYVFYSFISAIDRLRGTMLMWGFLTPILLTLPAAISLARHLALYDGCIGIGGWECSNYDSSGPDFNGNLCLLPILGALSFLPPMSEITRGSMVVGMFYGLIMSVIVISFSYFVGVLIWAFSF